METVYDKAMRAAATASHSVRMHDVYEAFKAVADPLVTGSEDRGPAIKHLLHIRPLMKVTENIGPGETVRHLVFIAPVDPYGIAFSWAPQPAESAPGLVPFATIKTLHRYGYYGFFKPSIAEVLSQIPTGLVERTVGFTCSGPHTAYDLNEEPIALNAGFQVATTTLYERVAST